MSKASKKASKKVLQNTIRGNDLKKSGAAIKSAPKVKDMKKLIEVLVSFSLFFSIPIAVCLIKTFEIIKNIFQNTKTMPSPINKCDSLLFIAVILMSIYAIVDHVLGKNESFIYLGLAILALTYKAYNIK